MARPIAFRSYLRKFIGEKREAGLKDRTVSEYRRVNLRVLRMLEEAGLEIHPLRIGQRELNHLRFAIPTSGPNFRNQQYHVQLFVIFLNWTGNPIKGPRWPEGIRTHADWLNEDGMETIRLAIRHDPELSMMFHLEGDLALRRVEVQRLRLEDFEGDIVHVLGKGRGPGKPRDLRAHPETDSYLAEFLIWREDLVRRALRRRPQQTVPSGLMLYSKNERLGVCGRTALDSRLDRMRLISGVRFGHHTLRRTAAREWWKCGVPLETIAEMLGHRNTETTRKYLGIRIEDQREALALRYARQVQVRNLAIARGQKSPETPIIQ